MSFFFNRTQRSAATGVGLLLGLALAGSAAAQTMPPPGSSSATAYVGPHFAGGPDSLQHLLQRATRAASPALVGEVFLHLELNDKGKAVQAALLSPRTGSAAAGLVRNAEVQAIAQQVLGQLPAWQLVPPAQYARDAYQAERALNLVTLPLVFGPAAAALPYSDESPTFTLPAGRQSASAFPFNLIEYVQRQVRYPAQDLRNQVQGVVYAYFEVSETGALEQRRIVGSVSPTLDAEIMRVLQQVPAATAPPRQNGRAVRVGYVLPFTFKIQ